MRHILCSLTALFILLSASRVDARSLRIALLEIEGVRDNSIGADVDEILRDLGHRIVRSKVYRKQARRLRAKKLNAAHVRKVSAFLSLDAVLFGSLQPSSGKYMLVVKIREGKTGRLVDEIKVRLRGPQLSGKIKGAIRKRMIKALGRVTGIDEDEAPATDDEEEEDEADDEEDEEDAAPKLSKRERRKQERARRRAAAKKKLEAKRLAAKKKRQERKRRREAARNKRAAKRAAKKAAEEDEEDDEEDDDEEDEEDEDEEDDDEEDEDDEDDDDEDDDDEDDDDEEDDDDDDEEETINLSSEELADRKARGNLARVYAGASVVRRSLQFSNQASVDVVDYEGSFAPGLFIAGEVYPFAFEPSSNSPLRNLGIGFSLERALAISTTIESGGMQTSLDTTQNRIGVDARYRINMGDSPTQPTIFLGLGINRYSFIVKRGNLTLAEYEVPNTKYTYVDPKVGIRFPFGAKAAFNAMGGAALVLGVGEIGDAERYGEATVFGADADVNIDYLVTDRIMVALGGHATYFAYSFSGEGAQTTMRDNDPDQDVGGAADLTLSAYLTLGFRY